MIEPKGGNSSRAGRTEGNQLVAPEERMDVLAEPRRRIRAHVFVAPSCQKLLNAMGDLSREGDPWIRLKQGQLIQTVVVISR
ncbi:hypothetical protein FXB40_42780 [Bradyrhizobium rifense]|uniref:Uncharacterized protein n=1 Tax=Bradyrhizobium rifense TaxID=515499 RepID=A0A5D3JZZ7_9BRAD|nr:hypothetical protein [Bradyrhizobium rifense]TYL85611.1 hypothetical protein FXB40_42780 [Bradyrhizobium rifense]